MLAVTVLAETDSERPGPITLAERVPPMVLVTVSVCCAVKPPATAASGMVLGVTVRFGAPPLTVRVTVKYVTEPSDPLTCTVPT